MRTREAERIRALLRQVTRALNETPEDFATAFEALEAIKRMTRTPTPPPAPRAGETR